FQRDLFFRTDTGGEHADAAQPRCWVLCPKRQGRCGDADADANCEPEHAASVHSITSSTIEGPRMLRLPRKSWTTRSSDCSWTRSHRPRSSEPVMTKRNRRLSPLCNADTRT